jgi:hypothetical protein
MAKQTFYTAYLLTRAKVNVQTVPEDPFPQVSLDFGGHVVPVRAYFHLLGQLQRQPPQALLYTIKLWPKTNPHGYLVPTSELQSYRALGDPSKETFHALGKLAYVDRDEARFGIQILPNSKGRLKKPFILSLSASLELLEQLPKKGDGVEVWGEFRPRSLRIMVQRFKVVPLPPTPALPAKEAELSPAH